MKTALRILVLFVVASLPYSSNGQIKIWQCSLRDSGKSVLYTFPDNRIRVDNLPKGAIIKFHLRSLEKTNGYYFLNVYSTKNKHDTLRIYKDDKLIYSKVFEIFDNSLHLGNISLCPSSSSNKVFAARDELLAASMLKFPADDLKFDPFAIQSFEMNCLIDQIYEPSEVKGNTITSVQQAMLNRLKAGDKVFIDNIRVKGPDGPIRTLAPAVIVVQ